MVNNVAQVDPKDLYYSLGGLERLLTEAEKRTPMDEDTIFELKAAIQFVHEDFTETFASLKTLLPSKQITFDHLWALYPPNTIIWDTDSLGNLQAYKVRKNVVMKDKEGMPWLFLHVDYIDSNGKVVGWVENQILRMPWFDRVMHIESLPYIPLEKGPDPDLVRKRLVEQGRLALKTHGQRLVEYKGPGLRKGEREWYKFNVRPKQS